MCSTIRSSSSCRAEMLTERFRVSPRECHTAICRHASCSTQTPISRICPVCSRIGMNSSGREQPFGRMHPAQQRLYPHDRKVVQVVDGLVHESELIPRKSGPEVVTRDGCVDRSPIASSDGRTRSGSFLRPWPCRERYRHRATARLPSPDPRRRCRCWCWRAGRSGSPRARKAPASHRGAVRPPIRGHHGVAPVDKDDELVTTHSPDGVRPPQGARQAGGDRHQQPVPRLVTQGVVDDLEIIDVDVQRGADVPLRRLRARSWSIRSMIRARFGRPVKES